MSAGDRHGKNALGGPLRIPTWTPEYLEKRTDLRLDLGNLCYQWQRALFLNTFILRAKRAILSRPRQAGGSVVQHKASEIIT